MKKISFFKKKRRKKFYFFVDFLSQNPIHNLKGIIKFLGKMGFQDKGWKNNSLYFERSKQGPNEKSTRLD